MISTLREGPNVRLLMSPLIQRKVPGPFHVELPSMPPVYNWTSTVPLRLITPEQLRYEFPPIGGKNWTVPAPSNVVPPRNCRVIFSTPGRPSAEFVPTVRTPLFVKAPPTENDCVPLLSGTRIVPEFRSSPPLTAELLAIS